MSIIPDEVRSGPADIGADPGNPPSPFDLARRAQAASDGSREAFKAQDRAQFEVERQNERTTLLEQEAKALRLEAIRRVLESAGTGEIDAEDWHNRLRPIAVAREGGSLLIVAPSFERDFPFGTRGPDLAEFCTLVVVDDPRDDEPTAPGPESAPDPGPDPDHVPPPAPGILRDVVLRCIGWWESARTAAMIHKGGPDWDALDDEEENQRQLIAMWDATQLSERIAREAEAMLGNAILHLVTGRPPTLANTEFHLEALRPAAVEFGGVCYTVVADPHEALNEQGPGVVVPIVARVESGRVVSIG